MFNHKKCGKVWLQCGCTVVALCFCLLVNWKNLGRKVVLKKEVNYFAELPI